MSDRQPVPETAASREAIAQARRLHQAGDVIGAAELYRQILHADPHNAEVHTWAGLACRQLNRLDEAVAHFREAIRLRPDSGTAYLNLADVYRRQGRREAEGECLRDCVRQLPDFPQGHFNLGTALLDLGRPEDALAPFREAVRLVPSLVEAYNGLGNALLSMGRVEEAAAQYRQALRYNPCAVRALSSLAANGLYSAAEPGVEQLRAWLANPRFGLEARSGLHFTLAHLLDRQGATDEAFTHMRQANALRGQLARQSGIVFDAAARARFVDGLIAFFTPEYFRRVQGYGLDSEVPVFVVGMPRSGTTLVEQILSCHPKVHGAGELPDIGRLVADLACSGAASYPESLAAIDPVRAREMAATYLDRLARRGGSAARVIDKMPENSLHLGLIATLFPRARVIHCQRDARDVCVSCFFQLFNSMAFSWDLGDLGRYYRDYERLMAHWRAVLPLRMLDVVYEDLVADQEAVSRRLVEFCGLDWDDRCLKFYENPRPVETLSRMQVRQPMYKTSVGRWRRYAAHLRPLLDALGYPAEEPVSDRPNPPVTAAAQFAHAQRVHQAGDLVLAEQLYRQLLQATPDYANAHIGLGIICRQLDRLDEAAGHFREAIRIEPSLSGAYLSLGNVLLRQGQTEPALECLRECVRQVPDFPYAHFNLGNTLYPLGRLDEAVAHYREAVRLLPSFADAHSNLGSTLLTLGRVDEAVRHFHEAVRHKPASPRALLNLAVHGYYTDAEPGIDQIESWLGNPQLDPEVALQLHFTAGYILDRAGNCDRAFEHFRQGNAQRRSRAQQDGTAFDPSFHSGRVDRLIAFFTPEYFQRVRGYGLDSEVPVFVVGMPRSGTTLVEQILSCHPKVHGAGELPDIGRLVTELSVGPACRAGPAKEVPPGRRDLPEYPEGLAGIEPARVHEWAAGYLKQLARRGGPAARVTDKMPDNYLHLGLIATLFPHARVIHCRRDPRDVCVSCFCQLLQLPYTWDLGDLGRYYRDYERLMAHWRAVLPLRMLEVVYEDLVADQEVVSRRLVEFCGLDWDDRCLKFHENPRPVETSSRVQVRQPLYKGSVGRWRRYAAHLGPLLDALGYPPEV